MPCGNLLCKSTEGPICLVVRSSVSRAPSLAFDVELGFSPALSLFLTLGAYIWPGLLSLCLNLSFIYMIQLSIFSF